MYAIRKAELLSEQVRRFASQTPFQLAAHAANLAFWVDEAVAALKTLDGYNQRFTRMKEAQSEWVEEHGTVVRGFCAICGGPCELEGQRRPRPPTRISSGERDDAARGIRDALRALVLRLFQLHLLNEDEVLDVGRKVGFGLEPADLEREPKNSHSEPVNLLPQGSPY